MGVVKKILRLPKGIWDASMDFIWEEVEKLTDTSQIVKPSEFAEQNRYLPPTVSSMSGYFSFEVTPYHREILDCLDPRNPVQELALMKGVQIGGTVGVLENGILWVAMHVKNSPVMLATADADLAKLRVEEYILPMFQQSGFNEQLKSTDESSTRKQGATAKKISWIGGGFLLPFGARSPNKMKSFSVRYLFRDEIASWPLAIGKFGDPLGLTKDRTNGYSQTRKVLDVSSPGEKGSCLIERQFELGDKRYYMVPCLECGEVQRLRWHGIDKETGLIYGMKWETDENGTLIPGTTRYVCKFCGHEHTNEDKVRMFPDEHLGGKAYWKPYGVAKVPNMRSYHLSALYAPASVMSWEQCVIEYLKAWDEKKNKVKDYQAYKRFYNSILGEPFEVVSGKIHWTAVSKHRRSYERGIIPDQYIENVTGFKTGFVIADADVHGDNLKVAVWSVTPGHRVFLIDYLTFEAKDTDQDYQAESWEGFKKLINEKKYYSDDGKREYHISRVFIDSSYAPQTVYQFCAQFDRGKVTPIKGREEEIKRTAVKEFSTFETGRGFPGMYFTVNLYKDTWSRALNQEWDKTKWQPDHHFNAYREIKEKELKELTAEYKKEIAGPDGGLKKYEWHRPDHAPNELWDLLIYVTAGVDSIIYFTCKDHLKLEKMDTKIFWDWVYSNKLFYIDR